MRCGRCQVDVSADFAFCPRCGNQLDNVERPPAPAPAASADRRSATVLFADLTGFTSISETLDPEDVRGLQTDLFDALRGVVERFDAFVEKFVGDAVMAVFGAPTAHEDDPQRALHAAIGMHAAVTALSERWHLRIGRPLQLRIGINSGRVVAGHLGSSADAAYAVTGDTVNTAARLQTAAEPGQTLVSEATFRLTQHEFAFGDRGSLALKGKAEPLSVHPLRGVADRPSVPRGLAAHGLTAPLLGRDGDLQQMLDAAACALAGRAQVVTLVAEAGLGKTRLVDVFLERVRTAVPAFGPAPVRRVTCTSLSQRPYGITDGLFRDAYGIAPADSLEEAQRKVDEGLRRVDAQESEIAMVIPVVGYILGLQGLGQLSDLEPETLKRQIFMTIRAAIERRLQVGPLVLVIEDLQWADAASLEGMQTLSDWLCDLPLVVVMTGRPPFEVGARQFGRAARTELRLAPLADDAIEALLGALFGSTAYPIERELHERIVRQAGGNPLYLEEVVRGLIASGVLVHEADGWRSLAMSDAVEVPSSIEGLLLSRIDRLPTRARASLQSASILGPVFERSLLSAFDASASDVQTLDMLCDAELLAMMTTGRYRFTSAMAHEVVYQNLLLRSRTQMHQRAGTLLESRCGPTPARLEDLEALCRHFSLGEDLARGARYLIQAGAWARGIYANQDALRYYSRALDLQQRVADADALVPSLHEHIGDLLGPMGRGREARAHYDVVLLTARAGHDAIGEARAQRKLAGLHWDAGERAPSLACLNDALRLLEESAGTTGRDIAWDIEMAQVCQEQGRLAFRAGDNLGAVEWAERALRQAEHADGSVVEEVGDDPRMRVSAAAAISHALNTLGAALARLERSAEAVVHIERSVAVAQSAGLLQAACRAYANLGVLYSTVDPGSAVQTCRTGLETAKKIGDLGFQSRLYANLAVAYCALTQRCDDEGLQAAQSAIDLDRKLGQLDHLAVPLIVLGQIHQCHGDADLALRYYEEALALASEIGEPQLLFPCYEGLATLYLDNGDDARAESYFNRADEVCKLAGVDRDSLVVLPFLC